MSYAQILTREAYLFSEFGESMARRYFGDDVIDSLPRFVRGKNKGKIKGMVRWKKVERGGWVNTGRAIEGPVGYVENRVGKVILVELLKAEWGQIPEVLSVWKRQY